MAEKFGITSSLGTSNQYAKLLEEAIHPFRDQTKLLESIIKPFNDQTKWYENYFKELNSQNQLYESLIKPFNEHAKQYEDIFKSFNDQAKLYESLTKPFNDHSQFLEDIKKSFYPPESSFPADIFKEVSVSRVLIEAAQELSKTTYQNADSEYSDAINDLIDDLPKILKTQSTASLNVYLDKVPEKVRWMLYVFFWCWVGAYFKAVFIDTAVGLTSDNLKPMIRAYICEKDWATNKIISALICGTPEGRLKSNRFVKVDHLHVRKTPNAKGEIIDLLPRFEPVTLIKKSENLSWSLIRYKNDDGEIMEGWVFSRYLYKPQQ